MDRFFRGLVAGLAGGIAMNMWTIIPVVFLKVKIIRFIDWAAVILYGDFPKTHFQGFYALIIQLLWVSLLGILFSYMLRFTTSRGYLLKGAYFGVLSGLIIYAIPTLLATPHLSRHSLATVVSNHIGGLIWGLTMAQTLRWLDTRVPSEGTEYAGTIIKPGIQPGPARKLTFKKNKR